MSDSHKWHLQFLSFKNIMIEINDSEKTVKENSIRARQPRKASMDSTSDFFRGGDFNMPPYKMLKYKALTRMTRFHSTTEKAL
jgi:hypothetical protein